MPTQVSQPTLTKDELAALIAQKETEQKTFYKYCSADPYFPTLGNVDARWFELDKELKELYLVRSGKRRLDSVDNIEALRQILRSVPDVVLTEPKKRNAKSVGAYSRETRMLGRIDRELKRTGKITPAAPIAPASKAPVEGKMALLTKFDPITKLPAGTKVKVIAIGKPNGTYSAVALVKVNYGTDEARSVSLPVALLEVA